jgi:arginine exporter protein ArgO
MTSVLLMPAMQGFEFNIVFVFSLGAQNALLLAQGASGERIWRTGAICFVFEAALLSATASLELPPGITSGKGHYRV